jgi:hypothetical protein
MNSSDNIKFNEYKIRKCKSNAAAEGSPCMQEIKLSSICIENVKLGLAIVVSHG